MSGPSAEDVDRGAEALLAQRASQGLGRAVTESAILAKLAAIVSDVLDDQRRRVQAEAGTTSTRRRKKGA